MASSIKRTWYGRNLVEDIKGPYSTKVVFDDGDN